jgi:hypothetical protein
MNKFTPSIVIWNLELSDKEDGTVYQNLYFLSYRMAKKFWKKHEAEFEGYKVSLGGEQLWLW